MSAIPFYNLKIYENRSPTAREFNNLVNVLRSIVLNDGVGYRINRTPCGSNLTLGIGGSGSSCPFDVSVAQANDDSGNVNITVNAGTVNNLLPSNNFDPFEVDPTDIIQVKISCYSDGQAITSCTLVVDTNAPAVQEPAQFGLPTEVDVLIAVVVNGVAYRVIGCGSIQLTSTQVFVTNPTAPASPGTLNYIPWYIWTVGTV